MKLLALCVAGLAAAFQAVAQVPAGKQPDPVKPVMEDAKPAAAPGGASSGSSLSNPDREDERKASESKEKMKKRPGYKHDVPPPRG